MQFAFLSLSSSFCWLSSLFLFCFTCGDHFVVTARHAEVTFSHSPALVPAAVRYLVGTVTSHVTYVINVFAGYAFFLDLNTKQDCEEI